MCLLVAARFLASVKGTIRVFFCFFVHRISRLTRWHKRAFFPVLNLARKITTSALFSSNLNRSLWMNFIYKKRDESGWKKKHSSHTQPNSHTHTHSNPTQAWPVSDRWMLWAVSCERMRAHQIEIWRRRRPDMRNSHSMLFRETMGMVPWFAMFKNKKILYLNSRKFW